jgi:hypothetical protein
MDYYADAKADAASCRPYYPVFPQPRYSFEDAAIIAGFKSRRSIENLCDAGRLTRIHSGDRVYIMHDDLMEFLAWSDKTPMNQPGRKRPKPAPAERPSKPKIA